MLCAYAQGIVGGTYDRYLEGESAVSKPESQLYLPPDVRTPLTYSSIPMPCDAATHPTLPALQLCLGNAMSTSCCHARAWLGCMQQGEQ